MIVHANKTHVVLCDGWSHDTYKRYENIRVASWKCCCGPMPEAAKVKNEVAREFYSNSYSGKWTGD